MSRTVFLSPSRQKHVVGNGEYGTEAERMNELGTIIEAELERNGIFVEREGNEIETDERIRIANSINADAYVSLHSNHAPENMSRKLQGTEIYVCPDNEESFRLASVIYKNMRNIKGFADRGIRKNERFTEVILPKMPCCLIETDYHDNYERSCWIVENIREIGIYVTRGILEYFGMEYKERINRKYYRIQLGAFTDKQNAERMSRILQDAGFPTVIKYY